MNVSMLRHAVADLLTSGTLAIGDGYRAKNDELGPAGLPFARAGNINDGFKFDDADFFPHEELHKVGNKVSEPGDVVFTSKGTVGRFALVRPDTQPFVYSPQLCFWRSRDRAVIDPAFLYYWMCGPEFYHQYKRVAGQTDRAEYVSLSDQRRMYISLPSPVAQRAIASVLGALDEKIHINRSISATLEDTSRALFESWFVAFDPVWAKAEGRPPHGVDATTAALFPEEFEDSELGKIPQGWRPSAIGNYVVLQRGTTYEGRLVGHPGPALLGLGSIEPGGGFREGHYKTYGGECPKKLMLYPGDLFVALKGATKDGSMVGSIARVPPSVVSGRLTQDTVKLEFTDKREGLPQYIYWLLRTPSYRDYCAGRITGSAQVGLSREDFLNFTAPSPPSGLLAAFGVMEARLAERKHLANTESSTLAELRDYLLPKLLSGEIRVRDAEKLAGAVL